MTDVNLAYQCSQLIEKEGYKSALVGGVAVGVWTEERFTKDLDFALAVETDLDAEKLVRSLRDKGFSIESVLEHKPSGSLAVVMLSSPAVNKFKYRVDLIFMQTGIEKEVVAGASLFNGPKNSSVRVASIGHLIALKVLAMNDTKRPQDRLDLKNLFKVASSKDVALAKDSLLLITKRGFNQNENLLAKLKYVEKLYRLAPPSKIQKKIKM